MATDYLTLSDVHQRTGLSVCTVRRYVRAKKLASVRLGRILIPIEEFNQFIKERTVKRKS